MKNCFVIRFAHSIILQFQIFLNLRFAELFLLVKRRNCFYITAIFCVFADSCEFGSNHYFLLCGLGGVLSCGITHTMITPLDLVKCRIQVDSQKYKSVFHGFRVIISVALRGFSFYAERILLLVFIPGHTRWRRHSRISKRLGTHLLWLFRSRNVQIWTLWSFQSLLCGVSRRRTILWIQNYSIFDIVGFRGILRGYRSGTVWSCQGNESLITLKFMFKIKYLFGLLKIGQNFK